MRSWLAVRFAARTRTAYFADVRVFLDWLEERSLAFPDVRTTDILAYQADLLAARKRDGKPYSQSIQINRISAIKSLYRFLYKRDHVMHDPAASVEYPHTEVRLPRGILTRQEARRLAEAPDTKTLFGLRDRAILEVLPTCSRVAPTSATSRSCSGMHRFTPPSATPESRSQTCRR